MALQCSSHERCRSFATAFGALVSPHDGRALSQDHPHQRHELVESRMQRELHVRFGGRAEGNLESAPRSDPYTYVVTWSGFVYVAFILDACSRYIVG